MRTFGYPLRARIGQWPSRAALNKKSGPPQGKVKSFFKIFGELGATAAIPSSPNQSVRCPKQRLRCWLQPFSFPPRLHLRRAEAAVQALANLRVTPVTAALERAKVDLRVTPAIVALEQARPDLQVTPATAALERAKADLPWRGNRTRNSAINGAAMSARPVRIMLMGAAVILSTIAPVPTFAESEQTEWNVQDLYKYCKGVQGSLGKVFCLEFVSSAARPVFTNGLTLKDTKSPPDLGTRSIPSACPKLFVSNDAMVEAFSEWANQHLENWSANAQTGVMQAMHDTWPCL